VTPPTSAVQNDRNPYQKRSKNQERGQTKKKGRGSASTKFLVQRRGGTPRAAPPSPLSQRSCPPCTGQVFIPTRPAPWLRPQDAIPDRDTGNQEGLFKGGGGRRGREVLVQWAFLHTISRF
jgi:hypothetical protein